MRIVAVDAEHPSAEVLQEAARRLRAGELVAFPTETVYGLGANALDAAAVRRIFSAKGRPSYNPIIVHVADEAGARRVASDWPETAERLAERFWPGPLTLVLRRRPEVPDAVTAGLDSVAVRVPAHPVALALLRTAGIPVAAPSANLSARVSPTTARHVVDSLGDRVAMIIDGGPTTVGIESTVLDLTGDRPVLLRPGMISRDDIEAVVGEVLTATNAVEGQARPSPGMMERHYAPRARVQLAGPGDARSVEEVIREERARGGKVGAMVRSLDLGADVVIHMPGAAGEYARRLYDSMHSLDDAGCTLAVIERVPDTVEWAGVRDRLERSAR